MDSRRWITALAKQLGVSHSDTVAVVRAGKNGAKRRTRRRERHRQRLEAREHRLLDGDEL